MYRQSGKRYFDNDAATWDHEPRRVKLVCAAGRRLASFRRVIRLILIPT